MKIAAFPLEGTLKRYPEIGDRPKKAISNPPQGSFEPLFGPHKGSIEPLREGLQNHRQGSIEPFASNTPFLGYPFKILPTRVFKIAALSRCEASYEGASPSSAEGINNDTIGTMKFCSVLGFGFVGRCLRHFQTPMLHQTCLSEN